MVLRVLAEKGAPSEAEALREDAKLQASNDNRPAGGNPSDSHADVATLTHAPEFHHSAQTESESEFRELGYRSMPRRRADDSHQGELFQKLSDELRQAGRKQMVRALANPQPVPPDPIVVRTALLRARQAELGYTLQDIANLIGVKDRSTVAAAMRCDPKTNLYTFIAIVNVLGLEMADVFPVREQQVVNAAPIKWERGPFLKQNLRLLADEDRRKR